VPHLFEFMDQDWLPWGLRGTLREILELVDNKPFRPYCAWVADEVLRAAKTGGLTTLVELGAGPGPITRLLARDARSAGLRLVPCDINPDRVAYEQLAANFPDKVVPRYDAVDFSQPQPWEPRTLLYLSATFHHIPPRARTAVLRSLLGSADVVMVFEPLRKTPLAMLFVLLSIVPALLLPAWRLGRPGRLRRILWCWLIPVAPLMFWWEGIVSCLRMWTVREWHNELLPLLRTDQEAQIDNWLVSQRVICRRRAGKDALAGVPA
jgi:SAM-dependent methyltransferase